MLSWAGVRLCSMSVVAKGNRDFRLAWWDCFISPLWLWEFCIYSSLQSTLELFHLKISLLLWLAVSWCSAGMWQKHPVLFSGKPVSQAWTLEESFPRLDSSPHGLSANSQPLHSLPIFFETPSPNNYVKTKWRPDVWIFCRIHQRHQSQKPTLTSLNLKYKPNKLNYFS